MRGTLATRHDSFRDCADTASLARSAVAASIEWFTFNADIYIKFREAVDSLCSALTHEDVAKALDVSVQTIRQARMKKVV